MPVPIRVVAALLGAAALGGCGVYLHDERLVTPATTAEASLTSASTTAPFDAQLAHLKSFAAEEDLAVARYLAAVRDDQIARLVAGDFKAPNLGEVVGDRIAELAPNIKSDSGRLLALSQAEPELTRLAAKKDLSQRQSVRDRKVYEAAVRDSGAGLTPEQISTLLAKTGCQQIRGAVGRADVPMLRNSDNPVDKALSYLAGDCWDLDDTEGRIRNIFADVSAAGGLLQAVALRVTTAEMQTDDDLSPVTQALEAEIAAADTASKKADKEGLASLRDDIRQTLEGVGQTARLAGWDRVDSAIGKLLKAEVCSAAKGTVDQAKLDEAKCDEVEPRSTAGKVAAGWAFAETLSQLLQAQDKNLRTTQWLLAAKAIVAAERADAKLKLDEAHAVAIAERARLMAHLRELNSLVSAMRSLDGTDSAACQGNQGGCAFGAYVLSWDSGRIQGGILAYRTVQIEREFAVRRAKSAAERQRALALVGAATLKAGADGGLKPELIAQLLFDLTLIGVTAGK